MSICCRALLSMSLVLFKSLFTTARNNASTGESFDEAKSDLSKVAFNASDFVHVSQCRKQICTLGVRKLIETENSIKIKCVYLPMHNAKSLISAADSPKARVKSKHLKLVMGRISL